MFKFQVPSHNRAPLAGGPVVRARLGDELELEDPAVRVIVTVNSESA